MTPAIKFRRHVLLFNLAGLFSACTVSAHVIFAEEEEEEEDGEEEEEAGSGVRSTAPCRLNQT